MFLRMTTSISSSTAKLPAYPAINDLIKLLLEDIKGNSAVSYSGGGSAIQNVMPKLLELGVLIKDALKNHCALHGANKPIENGLK